jgi:hypothetical protein
MRFRFAGLTITLVALMLWSSDGLGRTPVTRVADTQAGGAASDPRLTLPPSIDPGLKSEIEAAGTSGALEQVLGRHPEQAPLIVPRIEALATAEVRKDGPGARFVITEAEPDEGTGSSVTLIAGPAGMTLSTEFPGDVPGASFTDGSIHRFAGRIPFAELLTLYGDGDRNHRLTFAVLADYGMVYLRGDGRVVMQAQGQLKTIQLGSAAGK